MESGGRMRPHCEGCGYIQWRNPVVGVAAVIFDPADESRILMVRRATSYRGLWCLPCGYVEYDEEIRDALRREIAEETGLDVQVHEVVAVHSNFHNPDKQSVGVWFRAVPVGGTLQAGDDVDEIGFFPPSAPPALAFPTDAEVLRDLAGGRVRPATD
jgi:ADP-ribose pyrophosphatase YjhB (NUDIX family)